ncbi:glycosyl transferase family 2 [Gelidibacter sediminis]|uniref:Glycosyl transferase family 2 n=1 Tax=Gelidibacter sediminis TaxID=1608710 RepID=A0A4R7PX43_9FLAO|nr:glycosyltransferase family A protein [Gelidibacter sediminis]TDU39517.1 glycosyl transferase family 2 [Gelidibacter sediminis]
MTPYFSIIIPLYNKETHIKSTIQSVLDQTFQDFEVIVVNDGSRDGSKSVLASFSDDKIYYYEQENQGVSASRNLAISKAKSNYIALLDADDLWEPTYLETIYQLIQSFPEYYVFATSVLIETPNDVIPSIYSIDNLKDNDVCVLDYFESSTINSLLTSSSVVLHKSVFEKIGIYNTSIKNGEDTDLWIRIGIHYQIVFKNQALVTYRFQEQSLSNNATRLIDKPALDNYAQLETTNRGLKKFLDLNRFSMAMLAKLENDSLSFEYFEKAIDYANLNKKQQFLLKQPAFSIKLFHKFKGLLQYLGIHLSAFK